MLAGGAQAAPVQPLSGARRQAQGKVRVVVMLKAGKAAAACAAIAAAGGREMVSLDEVHAVAIELSSKSLAALQRSPHVDRVEADVARRAFAATAGAVRASVFSTGSQLMPDGIPMVQADQLGDLLASGRKLRIVDSGCEVAHEDLIGNQVDGVNLTTSGSRFADEALHGTHVGGTVSAINHTLGVVGVTANKQISVCIAKVFCASGTDGAAMLGQLGRSATVAVTASNYAVFNGTSMATPHVSAVAAPVWGYFPSCTASQNRDSLHKSALDLGAPAVMSTAALACCRRRPPATASTVRAAAAEPVVPLPGPDGRPGRRSTLQSPPRAGSFYSVPRVAPLC